MRRFLCYKPGLNKTLPFIMLVLIFTAPAVTAQTNTPVVEDIFGRQLNEATIILVDWEGYLANPAIKLFVKPPANAALPGTAIISADEARMYFDLPSAFGESGPTKTITLDSSSPVGEFLVSIFPDRDTEDEDHILNVQFTDANNVQTSQSLNIHVVDQDRNRPLDFEVSVDFSQDQTGFFDDQEFRAHVVQAADDWAYFIADMNLDSVATGEEQSFILNPHTFDADSGFFVPNQNAYEGFLLYPVGIHTDALHSLGVTTLGPFQTNDGMELPLRRSGLVAMETQGNFNILGWYKATGDADWWFTGNLGSEVNDFYSIVHHEIGHALFFNAGYPNFEAAKNQGFLENDEVFAYHGSNPNIDASSHFNGEVDNASRRGIFGNEYFGDMPRRRWLITKLDLLLAQAIGYELRETSALIPLSIAEQSLPEGTVGEAYSAGLQAAGGIPFYNWRVESGGLPDGLELDSFTGMISGTPTTAGAFDFVIRLHDYASDSTSFSTKIRINDPATSVAGPHEGIPTAYELAQNYPNPFNPETSITFRLPRASAVKLIIHNLLGREIRTLVDERFPAGIHTLRWDGRDDNRVAVVSGIYLYRIRTGDFSRVRKMTLLR